MDAIKRHIGFLLAIATTCVLPASCDIGNDPKICDYTVQLRYDYNMENTTTRNMLEYYVASVDEYIFDETGALYQYRRLQDEACVEKNVSELQLPPGRYSVVAWGNKTGVNTVSPEPEKGVTTRDELLLSRTGQPNAAAKPADKGTTWQNGDRLYYGYRTFTVGAEGISRIRVDMVHSHLVLRFRVRWTHDAPAPGNYTAYLGGIGSEYAFMPEFIYPVQHQGWEVHDPDNTAHDPYPQSCPKVRHHIPGVHHTANLLDHRIDIRMLGDRELWGEFITYRIRQDSHPLLSIFDASGVQILHPDAAKIIDLQRYFIDQRIDLDHTLKQEYDLDILIDGKTVYVTPLHVADWDEGGAL